VPAILREISVKTSYQIVRLVFRPYTQIRRTICTSVSLRASIRISSDFTLFKHSSQSFGSHHVCFNLTFLKKLIINASQLKKVNFLFFLMIRRPPRSTLFPYTTLPYPPTHLNTQNKSGAGLTCECHGFGGVLEPRYIVGAESLDQWAITHSFKGGCFQANLLVVTDSTSFST